MLTMFSQIAINQSVGLEDRFLKSIPKSPTALNSENIDNIAAYIVLSHAAIEQYFEHCVQYAISRTRVSYKKTNIINHILSCIMLYSRFDIGCPEEVPKNNVISQHAFEAIIKFEKEIKKSNGIKESNLTRMFHKIGFNLKPHSILIAECNELGTQRGSFAHNHAAKAIKMNGIDPRISVDRVKTIYQNLDKFSEELGKYINKSLI